MLSTPFWLFLFYLVIFSLAFLTLPSDARSARRQELRIPALEGQLKLVRERRAVELQLQVTAAVRESINDDLESYETTFRLYDKRGLEQLADHDREIPTRATAHLRTIMAALASGSIGLSGARGAGKTALIYSFTEGTATLPVTHTRRGFVVSAPVRYDAREFVLHLFSRLCEAVLGEEGLAHMRHERSVGLQVRRLRGAAIVLALAGGILAVAGVAVLLAKQTSPHGPQQTGLVFIIIGGALAAAAAFLWQWSPLQIARTTRRRETPERHAEVNLDEIRYQQTLESGWSGGLQLPLGLTLGGSSELALERAAMTLPEVVDRFRAYLMTLTTTNYWVIGIDELDKMESEDAARRFLNDIKGVFGVPGCYYLVSVSEDAMSSFERRGLPFRDVFDSSFDAIERIGYLSFEEAQALLERRVVGLPVPFQVLCYCMSGGLPRDLIRVARELVHQGPRPDRQPATLTELAEVLLAAELEGKVAAAIIATRAARPSHD